MVTPDQIAKIDAEARSWLDTPYVPHGRVKGVGVDCGHLLWAVYSTIAEGLPLPPEQYAPDWALHTTEEKYLDFIMPFVRQVPKVSPGGFSLYHVGRAYSHAAIFLSDGFYIHAWGRLRAGRVMKSHPRIMEFYSMKSGFPTQHFEPK